MSSHPLRHFLSLRNTVGVMASLAVIISVAGCSTAPGPWLDRDRLSDDLKKPTGNNVFSVELITADVIMDQQRKRLANMPPLTPVATGAAVQDYRVEPPDVLSITVYGHPELASAGAPPLPSLEPSMSTVVDATRDTGTPQSQGARVAADGTIFYPTVGRIKVAGMSTEQIAATLTKVLGKRQRDPQVDVSVLRYLSQQVQVAGELKTPGTLPITDAPLTLVSAIARAGGATPNADLQHVQLTRDGKTSVLSANAVYDRGDIGQNVLLRAGDIVNVPDRGDSRVFIMGEAMKPSSVPMSKWQLTLADALTTAGSIDPKSADPRQVYVVRGARDNPTQPSIYRLDMTQIDSVLLATRFQLQPLDVVYIGTASAARFNRVLDQVLPSLQALFYTVQLGR
jgi:polysaccharide export outer membrane protein